MAQCKKDGCRETAVYHRRWGHKRYCEAHGHAYADKRDAALKARENMPDCESGISPSCVGKMSDRQVGMGETVCHFCKQEADELHRMYEHESRKHQEFADAKTVDQLKAWIAEYML